MSERDVAAVAAAFELLHPARDPRGNGGETSGSRTGGSLEFHDRRAYAPGDDVRHVDWNAFARSDQLLVRLHREEVAPVIEVFLDASASMDSTERKLRRFRDVAALLVMLARSQRWAVRAWICGSDVERVAGDVDRRIAALAPAGDAGLERLAKETPRLHPRALRVVVSDLLTTMPPAELLRPLARGAAAVTAVQILDDEELRPTFRGGRRLTDVETGLELDLVVDEAAVRAHAARLEALQQAWRAELRRVRGRLATFAAGSPLLANAAGPLRDAGLLGLRDR